MKIFRLSDHVNILERFQIYLTRTSMNVLGKTQKMKRHLEDQGLRFPTDVDQGDMTNRQSKSYLSNISRSFLFCADNVFRSRIVLKLVYQAVRANDLDGASEALRQMMTLLASQRIRQPLVELDLVAHLISNNIKVIHSTTFNVCILLLFFRSSSCRTGPMPKGKLNCGLT